jgi:hypothetical protein
MHPATACVCCSMLHAPCFGLCAAAACCAACTLLPPVCAAACCMHPAAACVCSSMLHAPCPPARQVICVTRQSSESYSAASAFQSCGVREFYVRSLPRFATGPRSSCSGATGSRTALCPRSSHTPVSPGAARREQTRHAGVGLSKLDVQTCGTAQGTEQETVT